MPLTQTGRLITVTTPLGADAFAATLFTGREQLSRPFAYSLDLVSENASVKPADLVGKPIAWTINRPDDSPRQFHGLVRRLAAGPTIGRGLRSYRAEVVPWLWFMTLTSDCKIFQKKTAPDIVKLVFDGLGFSDYKLALTGTYPEREYCVQYRETAFAFVSRLLEEEGIFYSFDYAADKHTLVLADAPSAYTPCDPHATADYRPDLSDADVITAWERRYEFGPGSFAHADYNFTTPAAKLLASADTLVDLPGIGNFERFDFPGNHGVAADGTARAKIRVEEFEVPYDTATGRGRCSSLRPGSKFTLAGHPSDDGDYLLTAVDHAASEPNLPGFGGGSADYSNTFEVIPADVPARPARITPRPRTSGPVTAKVVGPAGEEIHTDEYGRVKVHFPWDRAGQEDDTASCWVRVSEPWAGAGWGAQFLPRIGQEVVVDFLHGDPDAPLITGRVVNADNPRPYKLPDTKTQSGFKSKSTPNGGADDFNEIRFEDKKESEDFILHAQKDFHRSVENDDDLKVGHDQTQEITNARTVTVKEADDKLTLEKGTRAILISEGDHTLDVTKGDRSVTVGEGDDTHTITKGNRIVEVGQGNHQVTVKTGKSMTTIQGDDTHTVKQGKHEVIVELGDDTLTVKVGNQVTKINAGKQTVEALQGITLKSGPSEIKISPDGVSIKGLTVKIEGQVQTSIKGLITEVNADAILKLKGGIVMVN